MAFVVDICTYCTACFLVTPTTEPWMYVCHACVCLCHAYVSCRLPQLRRALCCPCTPCMLRRLSTPAVLTSPCMLTWHCTSSRPRTEASVSHHHNLTASHRRLPAPDVLSDLPAYLVELYVCGGFPIVLRSSSTPSTAGWVITAVAVLVLVLQTSTTAAARTSTGKSRMSSTPTMSMPPPASVSLTLKPRTQRWTSASGAEPTPSTLQTHQRLARIVQLEAESSASPEEAAAQGPRVAAATGPSRRCCHGGIGAATAA